MRISSFALILLVLCATLLPAQTQNIIYYDDANPTTGFANAFPFGSEGTRVQELIPNALLGATPALIQDLFVNPAQTSRIPWSVSEVVYADFEIRMGLTTSPLTTSWAANIPNPTTVYRGPLRVRFERDQWVPIGLPHAYLWNPSALNEDLVIDFIFWRVASYGSVQPDVNGYFMWSHSSPSRTISRAFLRGWTRSQSPTAQAVDGNGIKLGILLDDGNFVSHGGGCVGSSSRAPVIASPAGTWPQIGGSLTFQILDGPLTSVAFLSLGTNNLAIGPVTLPFDLAPLGAPGCFLWHDLLTMGPATQTDASGNGSITLPVPGVPGAMGARVYGSWICVDQGANALNLTTSGFATIILGT